MRTAVRSSISAIGSEAWSNLQTHGNPFVQFEFLDALERTDCVSTATGWYPCHVICEANDGTLLGVMPIYLKTNSYGEFVFDFAWAGAYQQAGLPYYPKLVSAVPFTPATGPRMLLSAEASTGEVSAALLGSALQLVEKAEASSLHMLFPDEASRASLQKEGFLLRKDCQFHWHNRGYTNFDDFLDTFTASKRKKTRRERRRVREAGITFRILSGEEIQSADWDAIMPLYESTFLRRGRQPYLNKAFFLDITKSSPQSVVVFAGYCDKELVGVAICFRSETTLYGRYWGTSRYVDSLHFEACYYQGIDYCIEHGLDVFEPGTQGEHKIARGFVPIETWSAHWLSHPQFAAAVDDYLSQERKHVERYIEVLGEHIPYKNDPL